MEISTPQDESAPGAIMVTLIDLLTDLPTGCDRNRAEAIVNRLDQLEYDARWQGASTEVLTAIKGARLLLELAELPPLPRRAPSRKPAGI